MRLEAPPIIQGGMGVGVSDHHLARTVSKAGQLGVVSGTGVGVLLARRLQRGDENSLESLLRFPDPQMAKRAIDKYYIPGGKSADVRFKPVPMWRPDGALKSVQELVILGNFVEVDLAKHGHNGVVGINYLEKIQRPHLLSLVGAMLAKVDFVLMGAGIPLHLAEIIDQIYKRQKVRYKLDLVESVGNSYYEEFDPTILSEALTSATLSHPEFLAIISTDALARVLESRSVGKIGGYIVEAPTAGGHNAPPRGKKIFNTRGEPVYGEKDEVNFTKLNELNVKYWLAGSYASPEGLKYALTTGALGIQVGSAFALCNESGIIEEYKTEMRRLGYLGQLDIYTDPKASPSGYPFKVVQMPGTLSVPEVYAARPRLCDIGYLQEFYDTGHGLELRCPSEPVDEFLAKGGKLEDTVDRKCLCNGLFTTVGFGQLQPKTHYPEPAILTLGDDHRFLRFLMKNELDSYSANDVINYLLST